MPIDPDNVRVDLLRIKRKLYISYPEGSKERRDFLLASKISELTYLQKLVPAEQAAMVFEEYDNKVRYEISNMALCIGVGTTLSMGIFWLHQSNPTSLLFSAYYTPFIMGSIMLLVHLYHMVDNWKSFQPFKREYKLISDKMMKIIDEVKRLSK
ncbi:MAG: hypothetical protein ACREBR_05075 [bacterium]